MAMRKRTFAVGFALLLFGGALVIWLLLVTAGVHDTFRALFHPRVYARALGTSVLLVVLATWGVRVAAVRCESPGPSPLHLLPILLILALVPAALQQPRTDFDQLAFNPGGRLTAAVAPSNPGAPTRVSGGGTEDYVGPGNPALLAAAEQVAAEQVAAENNPFTTQQSASPPRPAHRSDIETLLSGKDPIVISDEDYSRTIDLIWEAPEVFTGRTVELVSFVFRRSGWSRDRFTAARLSIWCCVVDAAIIGLLVETDERSSPVEGDWIRLRGVVDTVASFDTGTTTLNNVPILRNVAWESVAAPSFEYVFPADW